MVCRAELFVLIRIKKYEPKSLKIRIVTLLINNLVCFLIRNDLSRSISDTQNF
jgi:hypothetical protein